MTTKVYLKDIQLITSNDVPTKTSDLTNDSNFVSDVSYVHTDNNFTTTLKNKLNGIATGAEVNVQADWNVASATSDAFIKNKPTIPSKTSDLTNDSGFITSSAVPTKTSDLTNDSNFVVDANYVHTDSNYTSAEKTKLSGIATGAEVNVQANWTETNSASDAYIKNKPNLATVATSGSYSDLSGVPAIPAATNSVVWYGSSSTTAGTRIKNVTIDGFTASDLTAGAVFVIQFKYGNTVSNVEFSINQGIASGNVYAQTGHVSAAHKWTSDETVTFVYDGSAFIMCDGGLATTTYYGATKLSNSYSSTSESLAATPSAVKAAYDHATDANTAVTNLSNSLATVATSGSYTDLSNKPTIPTATSELTNDSGFVDATAIANKMDDNAPLFKTTLQNIAVSSTNKGANFSDSFAIWNPPSGYVCLGVIQWDWVSGTRQNWFNNYGIWADKTTIYVKLCNTHASSAASGTLEVCLLWVRADNTSHYAD